MAISIVTILTDSPHFVNEKMQTISFSATVVVFSAFLQMSYRGSNVLKGFKCLRGVQIL